MGACCGTTCKCLHLQGPLPELAPDTVSQVLQHVSQQQRLGACSQVSCAWRAAANTATTAINYRIPTSDKQSTLSPWLGKHGSSLRTLAIHIDPNVQRPGTFMLPFRQLSQLHSLSVAYVHLRPVAATTAAAAAVSSGQAASAPNSLAALTALTSLQLTSSTVDLSPLAACTNRCHLKLRNVADSSQQAQLDTLLNGALQQLVHLTCLDVSYNDGLTDAAFEHLSCLQQLQELGITSRCVTAASLVALPLSLTRLDLDVGPGTGSVRTVALSSSSTPRLQQLTGLQHLRVSMGEFDPALLVGLMQLRHLKLGGISEPPGTAALLPQLAKLTQLQHLDLNNALLDDTAAVAAYSTLTASSQLSHLDLADCFIPEGASKLIFSAGRQLPQLAGLAVDIDLFPSPGDMQQMVSCCPSLQSLTVGTGSLRIPSNVLLETAALADLQQLTRLTKLDVATICPLDGAAAAQLATLTTLKELCIFSAERLSPAGLLQLTQLTGLTELEVYNKGEEFDISVELQSEVGVVLLGPRHLMESHVCLQAAIATLN